MAPTEEILFSPPYCPQEKCPFHLRERVAQFGEAFYSENGWAKSNTQPYRVKKYRCKHCGKHFRFSTFKLEYRERIPKLNPKIFILRHCGLTNREISRQLQCSEFCVRDRLEKMFKWGLLRHTEFMQRVQIDEPVAYDGLENFAGTQYDPNNINQVVGTESFFIYDFGFAPLNRKGKMSPRQKIKNEELEKTEGKYSTQAIRKNTAEVIERVYALRKHPEKPLILYTDFHYQYRQAIQIDLKSLSIKHVKISSKAVRNFQNILFPVNHSDFVIRQQIAAFRRETISFSKTPERMVQSFCMFAIWKNYFRFQFVKKHVVRPLADSTTPAMHLGLISKPMEFDEFFDIKRTPTQVPLSPEWLAFYHGKPTFKRELKIA